jgi:5'-nucleotidase/UDP-sugar diphosphatase
MPGFWKNRFRTLAWALLAAGLLSSCAGLREGARPYTLTLLHINDHHSHLEPQPRTLQLDAGTGAPVAVAVDAAGFARVAAAFESLSQAAGPQVLKLHAGDALTGTLYFNRAGAAGAADAALMNTVCFDAFTLGNHEFDKGDAGLKGFLDLLRQGPCKTPRAECQCALWCWLGAASLQGAGCGAAVRGAGAGRAAHRPGGPDGGAENQGFLQPLIQTPRSRTRPSRAQREIDRLHAQGVNKIVLMSHIGYGNDQRLAGWLRGVDVIVGGDSHTLLGPQQLQTLGVGSPAGPYPTRSKDRDGKTVCIVQAWEYAQVVGELRVQFDAQGEVLACEGRPHVLIGEHFTIAGKTPSDEENKALRARVEASGVLHATAPQAAAAAMLQPYQERVARFNQTAVATAPAELCMRRVPGAEAAAGDHSQSSVACNAQPRVNAHGGDIQQLVAQAYLEVAQARYGGADIALQSAGGVRGALQGQVTASDVMQVLPFGNMLHRLDVTGDEVHAMLEDGLEAVYGPGGSTGPYPYTAGLRFDVDATAARGQRVSRIEVRDARTGQWAPLDRARTYRMFALSFNARGGDGYKTLAAVPAARRLDVGVLDADVFLSYIEAQPKDAASGLPLLQPLDPAFYSTRRFKGPN